MSIESRKSKQELLELVQKFLNTRVHKLYVSGTQETLRSIEQSILDTHVNSETAYEIANLQGQRTVLFANITLFEDAVATLENEIQQELDKENETLRNQTE